MSESVSEIIRFCFEVLNFRRINIETNDSNIGCKSLIKKMGCSQNKESSSPEKAHLLGDTKGQGLDQVRRRRAHTDPARRWRRARRKRRRQRQQDLSQLRCERPERAKLDQILAKTRIQIWQRRLEGERQPDVSSVMICIS